MSSTNNSSPTRVVTGKARISYEHLTRPYSNKQGEEPKYSVTLLIPKSDYATKQRIDAAVSAAIAEGIAGKWNGTRPPQIPLPIYDGDGVRPSDGTPFAPECRGCWVITASSRTKPEIVDLTLNPIIDATQIYSGMYARVSIRFFAYLNTGKKGIGCGLNNVQKLEDGEPLGGRTSATDDFGGGGYEAAPAYPQAPQPQYAPAAPAYPQQPQYSSPAPAYPQQLQYPAPAPYYPPQQPAPAIDPITGQPVTGPIMGL